MAGASPLSSSTQQNISQHQKAIYEDGELDEEATHKKYLLRCKERLITTTST